MRLVLVRHGETRWNAERRIVGHTEIELNEIGREQAKRLAQAFNKDNVSAVYSSPLRRARQTAEEIARVHNLPVKYVDALKEFDAGEADGLTISEFIRSYGDFFERWTQGEPGLKMPGGESISDLQMRAWPVVERVIEDHPDQDVIVVSHTLTILTIIATALGMDFTDFRRLRLDLASISVLNFGPRVNTLVHFNQTCHWDLLTAGG